MHHEGVPGLLEDIALELRELHSVSLTCLLLRQNFHRVLQVGGSMTDELDLTIGAFAQVLTHVEVD
jgi:hypothetical protein